MSAIVADGLCKHYVGRGRGRRHDALRALSFTVESGRHAALLGLNGAGKSTTVKLLAGCLRADAGRALLMGHDVAAVRTARRLAGYVPDDTSHLYGRWTVRENAAYYGSLQGGRRADFASSFAHWADELDLARHAEQRVHTLSKGQRQRLAFLIALLHEPCVLLLDEPTTALDTESTAVIGTILRRYCRNGGAILLTSHNLDFVERHADEILLLDRGALVEHAPIASFLDRHALDRYEVVVRNGTIEPSRLIVAMNLAGVEAIHQSDTTTLHCTADHFHAMIDALKPGRPTSVRNVGRELSTILPRIAGAERNAMAA